MVSGSRGGSHTVELLRFYKKPLILQARLPTVYHKWDNFSRLQILV